ncbi:hypothetical protein FSP39_014731 [Pinctada imbricata]|uniref:Cysteine dioxygenase n=1 Tax=Pinctada imbricata TaxID=66713 RepID=A0AA88Y6I7_PINIB|nr:hypothetical protein FSP39_014731 [Pinctada imbricata]
MEVETQHMNGNFDDLKLYSSKGVTRKGGKDIYGSSSTVTPPESLNELIKELREVFSHDDIDADYVKNLMSSYKSNPKEWKKFAKWDPHRYTRNLVDSGNDKFNLMILCWNSSQGSSIHDHANAHCFMKVLDGEIQEELFEWPTGSEETAMKQREKNKYHVNEVAYINDEIGLHRVENPSHSNEAVTLHLYSPPFSECQSFDERTGHCNKVKVTFWSKYGKRTPFVRIS